MELDRRKNLMGRFYETQITIINISRVYEQSVRLTKDYLKNKTAENSFSHFKNMNFWVKFNWARKLKKAIYRKKNTRRLPSGLPLYIEQTPKIPSFAWKKSFVTPPTRNFLNEVRTSSTTFVVSLTVLFFAQT